MYKVQFYFYQSSPRVHINHLEKMNYLPQIGDTITLINDEFFQLNKNLKEKNHFFDFKVSEREIRMKHRPTFYCDVRILLTPLTEIK